MELVPIIYDVLLFVTLLLIVAISVSFIASRFKKKTVPNSRNEEVCSLNEIRNKQAEIKRTKPIIHQLPSHSSHQRTAQRLERKKTPNIKVIRRSGISSTNMFERSGKTRTTYYPNIDKGRVTKGLKSRYTILNDNSSENKILNLNSSRELPEEEFEQYANFR